MIRNTTAITSNITSALPPSASSFNFAPRPIVLKKTSNSKSRNSVSKVIAMTGVGHRLEDQHLADHLPILKVEKEWHRVNTNSLK